MKNRYLIFLGVFLGCLILFLGLNLSKNETIYISKKEINGLFDIWENRTGRPPNTKEREMIINNLIDEEILYKESLSLGFDKNDKIIKRRLIQKLEFSKEAELIEDVNQNDLKEFYNKNINSYKIDLRYNFIHIFFSKSNDSSKKIIKALKDLESDSRNISGDPFIIGNNFVEKNRSDIERDFGNKFSENFENIIVNKWNGPFESVYGEHLIFVQKIFPEEILPFEKVKLNVVKQFNDNLKIERMEKYISSLKNKYDVIISDY